MLVRFAARSPRYDVRYGRMPHLPFRLSPLLRLPYSLRHIYARGAC